MTKKEADQFLRDHPKPWNMARNVMGWLCAFDREEWELGSRDLLRYIAYLEQENKRLEKDSRVLAALQDAGVDNWPPYDDIMGEEN